MTPHAPLANRPRARAAILPTIALLPSLLLGACNGGDTDTDGDSDDVFDGCEATVDGDVRTVINVRWTTDAPGESWVEYGPTDAYGASTPRVTDTAADRTVSIVGNPSLTEVFWRAMTDGQEVCAGSTETGNLPPGLPDFAVDIDIPEKQSPEKYLVGTTFFGFNTQFIMDRQGQRLWYREGDSERMTVEVFYRPEGNGLVFNEFDNDYVEDLGRVVEYGLNGREIGERRTELGHHVFTLLPDGTIAYLKVDIRDGTDPDTGESVKIAGDAVVEVARDGTTREVFNTWDSLPVSKVREKWWDLNFYPDGAKDWVHGNSLQYIPESDTYLVNFMHLEATYEIKRSDGSIVRQFGGEGGYTIVGDHEYIHAHDVRLLPDGHLSMFASIEEEPETITASGGVEFVIDDTNRTLTQVWSYGFDQGFKSTILGQVRRLQNGNRLLTYAPRGQVREVTPDGEIVWQLSGQSGAGVGQVQLVNDPYTGE